MEQDEIIDKIKRYMEEKLELEAETCYFLTKKLNEEYWDLIKEPEDDEESDPDEEEDEFADFEEEPESNEGEEEPDPTPEEDLDIEDEIDIGNGKRIRKPSQPPIPPPGMSTRPKIMVKKPSIFAKK